MPPEPGSAPEQATPQAAATGAGAILNVSPPPEGANLAGTSFDPAAAPAADPWYKAAGIADQYHAGIAAKGWTGPEQVLESYVNLERIVGLERGGQADRIMVRPGDKATPEEIQEFIGKATGGYVPKDAAGYGFKAPEGMDATLINEAADWALKAGMPAPMAQKFIGEAIAAETARVAEFQAASEKDITDLTKEWGKDFDNNAELARRGWGVVTEKTGITADQLTKFEIIFGTGATMKMMHLFGQGLTEMPGAGASLPGMPGAGGGFRMTAEAAQAKITELHGNSDFMARYLSPNPMMRQKAIEEMEGLQKIVSGVA